VGMRRAVKVEFLDQIPMQAAEKRHILALHMGVKGAAATAIRRADRKADQFGPKTSDAAMALRHRQPRPPPDARRRLMDAHRGVTTRK
jgi:hypothetical protein